MTEAEWLACDDSFPMLESLPHAEGERKLLLFALACCRAVGAGDPEWDGPILDAADRYVGGTGTAAEVKRAGRRYDSDTCPAQRLAQYFESLADGHRPLLLAHVKSLVPLASWLGFGNALVVTDYTEIDRRRREQAALLREVFGNPFRPVAADPSWLASDVVALARGIYEEKAFDRMPILADALQDAGCANEDVLNHCRDGNAPHVRGCWVVDLLLGKG